MALQGSGLVAAAAAGKADAGDKRDPDFDPQAPGLDDAEPAQDVAEHAVAEIAVRGRT